MKYIIDNRKLLHAHYTGKGEEGANRQANIDLLYKTDDGRGATKL